VNPTKAVDGWTVFESEVFPALGLGRAWFAFPPVGYVAPQPAAPPLPNILDILTERTPRTPGQRQRPRRVAEQKRGPSEARASIRHDKTIHNYPNDTAATRR
jgi:hypothetical protein